MSRAIAVVGESGSGKSTAMAQIPALGIIGLDPAETFIINIKDKDLPFRGWKKKYTPIPDLAEGPPATGNYFASTDPESIVRVMKYVDANRSDIKTVVLDDKNACHL